jgi:hypothetical protein
MCDYSLEHYRSRPAQLGERYETHQFESRSIGFVAPGDPSTAVCMACDTTLRLENVPETPLWRIGESAAMCAPTWATTLSRVRRSQYSLTAQLQALSGLFGKSWERARNSATGWLCWQSEANPSLPAIWGNAG